MALLRALDQLVRGLTSAAVSVSAVLILAIAVIVTVDVASAFLLNSPIPIVSELSSATLAVIIFGALAYAQYRQQNVKVDLVLALLSSGSKRPGRRGTVDQCSDVAVARDAQYSARSRERADARDGDGADRLSRLPVQNRCSHMRVDQRCRIPATIRETCCERGRGARPRRTSTCGETLMALFSGIAAMLAMLCWWPAAFLSG